MLRAKFMSEAPSTPAKTDAAKDPWLKVEGSTTRPVFVMRDKPVSLVAEAEIALGHQNDFGGRIGCLREYLARTEEAEVKNQVLELATKVVEQAIAEKKATHAHILDGILFLEENGHRASVPAAQELKALLVKDDGSLRPVAIDRLATQALARMPPGQGAHLGTLWALCMAVVMLL